MLKESEYYSDRFKQILAEYGKTLSDRTYIEYSRIAISICDYVKKDFLDINELDAQKYFDMLKASIRTGDVTRKTVGMRMSCCNSISKYIEQNYEELTFLNPFKNLVRPEISASVSPNSIPSIEELDLIMTQARAEGEATFLIMALATRMSLSSTAIIKLTKNDILEEKGRYYLKTEPASTKPSNLIMIPEDVVDILKGYVSELDSDAKGHLFYNKHGRPLTLRNLDSIAKKVIGRSGVDTSYTIKDLRKRGVLELAKTIKNQEDMESVADYIGIKANRLNDYMKASSYISNSCPPNLVNYRLKTDNEDNK